MTTRVAALGVLLLISPALSAQNNRADLGVRPATFTSTPPVLALPGSATFSIDFRVNWPRLTLKLEGHESDQYIELRVFDLAQGAPDPDLTPQTSDKTKPRQPRGIARISGRYDRDLPAGTPVHLQLGALELPTIARDHVLYIVPLYVRVVPSVNNTKGGQEISDEETALEIGVGKRYVRRCQTRLGCAYVPIG